MMMTLADSYGKEHTWADALKIELQFEGGKDDDPIDPGGRTNQGVIQRVFSAWLRKNGKPARDVFTMTNIERDQIYYENYGQKVRYNELPPGVDIVVLDGGVNSGPGQSIKWLQRALGIGADGVLGDVTLAAVLDYPNHDELISKIIAQRERFLRALKTFYHFGKGWLSRINQLKKVGQAWAMGNVGPVIVWTPNMNKKATLFDAPSKLSTAPADAVTAGGGVSTALSTVQETISPLAGMSDTISNVLTAILVIGVLCTAFGFGYAWWVRRRNSALEDALDTAPVPIGANDNAMVPQDVLDQYADPKARGGSETGNIAPGNVTTSGRTAGDTEVRRNPEQPVPAEKAA